MMTPTMKLKGQGVQSQVFMSLYSLVCTQICNLYFPHWQCSESLILETVRWWWLFTHVARPVPALLFEATRLTLPSPKLAITNIVSPIDPEAHRHADQKIGYKGKPQCLRDVRCVVRTDGLVWIIRICSLFLSEQVVDPSEGVLCPWTFAFC
jgi:hypothetical protein